MIKSPEIWAKLNVHMQNPDVEHGSFKEQIFSKIYLRKQEEEYLENVMLVKAMMEQDVQEDMKKYTDKKFPWQSMIREEEEQEAAEILEEEAGKTYRVAKQEITKKKGK